jgi:polyisoprenoid-binding protein YceI
MKRNVARLLLLIATFLPSKVALAEEVTYTLDPNHSYVLWHINHFGFSNPSGKWEAEGTLVLDEQKPQNSKVNATIAVGDMITGIPELDKHLKGTDFFDVDKYPTATFVSDKVTPTSKTTAKVHGILTLHGISKPVTLDVKLNKLGENPVNHKVGAGFSATTDIKRSDFDIKAYIPGLSDAVKLNIEAEAYK